MPDWFQEQSKVAVYLDGMSRGLHGDPKTAQMDQLIRGMLELQGYKVIVVQSRDLDDPRQFVNTSRASHKPLAGPIWQRRSRQQLPNQRERKRYKDSRCAVHSSPRTSSTASSPRPL